MANVEQYADELLQLAEEMKALKARVNHYAQPGNFLFGLDQTVRALRSMFDRFCPFEVGSRVELTKTPTISEEDRPGWRGCEHFLVQGAKATVVERDYASGKFRCALEFDNESWLNTSTGERHPVTGKKHSFTFSEDWVRVLPANAVAQATTARSEAE